MSIIVFVGPSLPRDRALAELDATYLPPASQGDVYLAARKRPWGIGLIDGYFLHVPAVWHKEILWALSRGVHVFGAASMGALRAAELAPFGMRGVGRIAADFAAGVLQDDDEVAIVHSDADDGYRALTDALVNIRATLSCAVEQGIIGQVLGRELLADAKCTFYQRRSYARLLKVARGRGAWRDELDRFEQWLSTGAVDQKQRDAVALLREMRDAQQRHPAPLKVAFRFQHTDAWEQVRRQIHLKPLHDSGAAAALQGDAVLSELRLEGSAFVRAREAAFQHALCQELAGINGEQVDAALIEDVLNEFRVRHGLEQPGSVEPWLANQGLDPSALTRLLLEGMKAQRQRVLFDSEIERVLVQQLRLSGRFRALQARAVEKQEVLHRIGLQNPDLDTVEISEAKLWAWYFGEQLGREPDLNPDEYASALGCSKIVLRREVLREWLYQQHCGARA